MSVKRWSLRVRFVPRKKRSIWQELGDYLEAIVVVLIVTAFTTVSVAGSSMYPNIQGSSGNGIESFLIADRVFVPKYDTWLKYIGLTNYKRGDILIFREIASKPCRPDAKGGPQLLVKRLIGLPGDHVFVNQEGGVWINDIELDQGFITNNQGSVGPNQYFMTDVVVPENEFFFMGDNRTNSCDSRLYGTIPFTSVLGKASAVIWPPLRNGHLNIHLLHPPVTFQNIPNP
jgi:signal peptidase I